MTGSIFMLKTGGTYWLMRVYCLPFREFNLYAIYSRNSFTYLLAFLILFTGSIFMLKRGLICNHNICNINSLPWFNFNTIPLVYSIYFVRLHQWQPFALYEYLVYLHSLHIFYLQAIYCVHLLPYTLLIYIPFTVSICFLLLPYIPSNWCQPRLMWCLLTWIMCYPFPRASCLSVL